MEVSRVNRAVLPKIMPAKPAVWNNMARKVAIWTLEPASGIGKNFMADLCTVMQYEITERIAYS
jgi:hypothetical protein